MKHNEPDSSSPSLARRGLVALVTVVVGVAVGAAVWAQRRGDAGDTLEAARPLPVRTVEPVPAPGYDVRRSYTGVVRAMRRSAIGFERGGRVIEVLVREGQEVTAEQPLARLDHERLDASRQELLASKAEAAAVLRELEAGTRKEVLDASTARVDVLRTQHELAQRKFVRRQALRAAKQVTVEELDEAELAVATLAGQITVATAQLAELRAGPRQQTIEAQRARVAQLSAKMASLDVDVRKSALLAPFAGRVEVRAVDEGAVIVAGHPVITLVESAPPELRIGVPPSLAARLTEGDILDVSVDGAEFKATLKHKLPSTERRTRTQPLVLTVAKGVAGVVPGQVARLYLKELVEAPGLWVPSSALLRAPRGLWALLGVDKAEGKGTVIRHLVEVLHTEGERTLVRGTLTQKDAIITGNVERVVVGQSVVPMPSSK